MDQNWSKGFKNGLKRFQGDSNQPFPEGRKKTFKKLDVVVQQQYNRDSVKIPWSYKGQFFVTPGKFEL